MVLSDNQKFLVLISMNSRKYSLGHQFVAWIAFFSHFHYSLITLDISIAEWIAEWLPKLQKSEPS